MGLCLGEKGIAKTMYGFDSIEGIDAASFAADLPLGDAQNEVRHRHGIRAAQFALVASKVRRFFLTSPRFVPGYFKVSFPGFDTAVRVCFAHPDVNLYEPFRDSLNFRCPAGAGGIIMLDEHKAPPGAGCNRPVDEFLADKPGGLEMER